jgi:TonB family protein
MHKATTIALLISFFLLANISVRAQHGVGSGSGQGGIVLGRSARQIPDANVQGSPEETQWWQELKQAGERVQKSRASKKDKQKFLDLLQVGNDKSYRPPVTDNKPVILAKFEPSYDEQSRRMRVNGIVVMGIELRADGFIGAVTIKRGLTPQLNEQAEEAARRTVFLPAVKDRKFVAYSVTIEMSFSVYWGRL